MPHMGEPAGLRQGDEKQAQDGQRAAAAAGGRQRRVDAAGPVIAGNERGRASALLQRNCSAPRGPQSALEFDSPAVLTVLRCARFFAIQRVVRASNGDQADYRAPLGRSTPWRLPMQAPWADQRLVQHSSHSRFVIRNTAGSSRGVGSRSDDPCLERARRA